MATFNRTSKYSCLNSNPHKSGFALVVALSVMSVVLLLVLLITTLVRVEQSASSTQQSRIKAEQNALLSLNMALGELQKSLGPDQRISASASILGGDTDTSKQHLTGVWSSTPSGGTYNEGELIGWLASGADGNTNYHQDGFSTNDDTVILVNEGSLGTNNNDDIVSAQLEPVDSEANSGQYSWWIGDEGIKASINLSQAESTTTTPRDQKLTAINTLANSSRSTVSAIPNLLNIDLQSNNLADKLSSLNDLNLDGNASDLEIKSRFHSLTLQSRGVLSDTKNGGLKEDLSLAFEMSDADFNASKFGNDGSNTLDAVGFGNVEPLFVHASPIGNAYGPAWHLLRDYYTIYQRMETPMQNPTFQAQAYSPSKNDVYDLDDDADDQFSHQWSNNINDPDPLRSDTVPLMVNASYLPYNLRNHHQFGVFFENLANLANNNSALGPGESLSDYRRMRMFMRSHYVYHNPFNVTLHHGPMVSEVVHIRFRLRMWDQNDVEILQANGRPPETGGNWSRVIIEDSRDSGLPLAPGEIVVYEGTHYANTNQVYSARGNNAPWFGPHQGANVGRANNQDTFIPPGTIRVKYEPYSNNRWAYEYYNMMLSSPNDSFDPVGDDGNLGNTFELFRKKLTEINGIDEDIRTPTDYWWGDQDDEDGVDINTEQHYVDGTTYPSAIEVPKFTILSYDTFVKAAEYEPDHITDPATSLRYPAFALSNPMAPVIMSKNLLPDPTDTQIGIPYLSPGMQLAILGNNSPSSMSSVEGSGGQAYWGNTHEASGRSNVSLIDLPTSPPLSIGKLQNANIGLYGHMPALAIGNSFASPYIASDEVSATFANAAGNSRVLYDLSYLSNEALWDSYFFSSYSLPYDADNDNYDAVSSNVQDLYESIFEDETTPNLPNARMQQQLSDEESAASVKTKLFAANGAPKTDAYTRSAENLMINGAFNVNSVSVDAWTALLSSSRDAPVYLSGDTNATSYTANTSPISRLNQPIASAYDADETSDTAWGGFRNLSDTEVQTLAQAIVDEIKLRVEEVNGNRPYLSLADFVNRNLSQDVYGRRGLLQAAIERSGINGVGNSFGDPKMEITRASLETSIAPFPHAANIENSDGSALSAAAMAPAHVLQGDILQAIGSFISVRSDTFRIRAYGNCQDPLTGEIKGQAWCEAIVQRIPTPVAPTNPDPANPNFWSPQDAEQFGRQFTIIGFRWLSEDEV